MDVAITTPSTYQMILRYTNSNPTPAKGEVTMFAPDQSLIAQTVTHAVVLQPTGGQVQSLLFTLKTYLCIDVKIK